jgi:hypothetical protein
VIEVLRRPVESALAAAVAVEDHPARWPAGDEGGGEGLEDQAGAQVIGHGVADDLAGVQVDHGRGVDPAVDGGHVDTPRGSGVKQRFARVL